MSEKVHLVWQIVTRVTGFLFLLFAFSLRVSEVHDFAHP